MNVVKLNKLLTSKDKCGIIYKHDCRAHWLGAIHLADKYSVLRKPQS